MPLTRSQAQAAFKAARKHFKGKIPKGTKLARFVPGHHSKARSHVANSSPKRSRRSRVGGAVKRVARKQGLVSKATSAIALVIGTSPAIMSVVKSHEQGFAASGTLQNLAQTYGINPDGTFNFTTGVKNTVGPVVLAIIFKKGISYLQRVAKLRM